MVDFWKVLPLSSKKIKKVPKTEPSILRIIKGGGSKNKKIARDRKKIKSVQENENVSAKILGLDLDIGNGLAIGSEKSILEK